MQAVSFVKFSILGSSVSLSLEVLSTVTLLPYFRVCIILYSY